MQIIIHGIVKKLRRIKKNGMNHKVTCSECLHSINNVRCVDGLPFRYDIACRLKHETDYRVPYSEHWDCTYYEKWTIWKSLKRRIKELNIKRE